jgi:hypothetical protein
LRQSLRARQIPNSEIGSSFEQIGQCFTWGEDSISIISTTPLGIQTRSAIRNRTTLHPHPALNASGKDIYLGVIFLAKIPLGAIAWIALRNHRT